jgi:hypothetical protein
MELDLSGELGQGSDRNEAESTGGGEHSVIFFFWEKESTVFLGECCCEEWNISLQ